VSFQRDPGEPVAHRQWYHSSRSTERTTRLGSAGMNGNCTVGGWNRV
jgi:hypothetical protein